MSACGFVIQASTDQGSLANSKHWIHIAHSFVWLQGIETASALKILPRIKRMPAEAVAAYKRKTARLNQADRNMDALDWAYLVTEMVSAIVAILLVSFAGVIALHLKLMVSDDGINVPQIVVLAQAWI